MKKLFNKKSVLVTAIVLILLVTVGGTLAYIFTQTPPVENTFTPSKVACAVIENSTGEAYTNNIVETGTSKNNVMIKNTGDTDAYIRVALVFNWMSEDGTKIWAVAPKESDYEIVYADDSKWELSGGYWYYKDPVAPGHLTGELITSVKLNEGVTGPKGTDGTQYYLSVEIVASAIQAKGMGVTSAVDAWVEAAK